MGKKILKNMDWGILVCIVILLAIGLVALFSATQGTEYEEFKKQIMWLAISIPIMIILTFVDYNTISKISPILYVLMIISLIAVMFTKSVNGATSWFTIGSVSIQPAEFAKIIAIISLSTYVAKIQEKGKDQISRPTRLLLALVIVAVPLWNSNNIYNSNNFYIICCRNKEKVYHYRNFISCYFATCIVYFCITRACKNKN